MKWLHVSLCDWLLYLFAFIGFSVVCLAVYHRIERWHARRLARIRADRYLRNLPVRISRRGKASE